MTLPVYFIRAILSVGYTILSIPFCPIPFCPFTILSIPFCPIPFCPFTILSIPFCPYHFVQYHFVRLPFCPRTIHTCHARDYKHAPVFYSFIHSFILNIYIAPLQENYSEPIYI